MREIKFRVWHKPDKTMHPYLKVKFGKSVNVTFDGKFKDVDQITTKTVPNKDIEIMQFTGLKDVNGSEIFEGDILEHIVTPDLKAAVIFEDASFQINRGDAKMLLGAGGSDKMEIIGNIYETPELLK